jgi:hypothetical protein
LTGATKVGDTLTLTNTDGSQVTATGFTDYFVTGSTLTSGNDNTNVQTSTLEYNLTPNGGPFTIVTENTYVTGGTYDNVLSQITFDRNDGNSFNVDLATLIDSDKYLTGGTYNPTIGELVLSQSNGATDVSILGFQTQNTFVTGGTYSNGTLTLGQNNGTNVTVPGFQSNDFFVTGGTYNNANGLITLNRQNGVATVSGLPAGLTSIPTQIVVAGTGSLSTLRTGSANIASGPCSVVLGSTNTAASTVAGILGGISNSISATGYASTIGGGAFNCLIQSYSTIGGGQSNCVLQSHSSIVGGRLNTNNSCCSTIGGGESNIIGTNVPWSTIKGGCGNNISNLASYSSAVGRANTVCLSDSHVLGCNITTDQCFTTFVNNFTVNGGGISSPNTCSRVTLKSLPTETEVTALPSGTVYRCTTSASGGGTQLWVKL